MCNDYLVNLNLLYIFSLCRPNEHTALKAKVDSDLVVSASFSQDIFSCMRMSLCTLVRYV